MRLQQCFSDACSEPMAIVLKCWQGLQGIDDVQLAPKLVNHM